MGDRNDALIVGTAAEHLVCADILLEGHKAFLAEQICPYDVIADLKCGKLIRIQVKSTREQRNVPQRVSNMASYMWNVRRAGKGGRRVYGKDEFDVLALVALDIGRIAYMPPEKRLQTIHIKPPGVSGGKQFDDFPFENIIKEFCA